MPEGPEIRRAADRVFKGVGGVPVTLVFHLPELAPWNELFESTRIERIETRGKAMLTWLTGGYVVYSHNQLYGRWEVLAEGKTSRSRRSLRVEIRSATHTARLLSATDIAILHEDDLHEHPFLQKLGPDALDLTVTPAVVRKRLSDKAWPSLLVSLSGKPSASQRSISTKRSSPASATTCARRSSSSPAWTR